MIFITLGTQKQQFTRLLQEVENSELLKEEQLIVQAGHTQFTCDRMQIFDVVAPEQFEEIMGNCEFLITHGGVGSIFTGILKNKKIIAMPRLHQYKEHVDDHQKEICDKLTQMGYILQYNPQNKEQGTLDDTIRVLRQTNFKKYIPEQKDITKLKNCIDGFFH